MDRPPTSNQGTSPPRLPLSAAGIVAALYALLLVYGTLFPLRGWESPPASPFLLMLQNGLGGTSRADILTNVFVYIPLGFLLVTALSRALRCRWCSLPIALLAGFLLSLTLEYLQAHVPSRVPSVGDLILNTLGTSLGALAALILKRDTGIGRHLLRLRTLYIQPGALANLGLVVLALWSLSQLGPLVPSLDLDNLRHGIKPLFKSLGNLGSLRWLELLEYTAAIAALGLLFLSIQRVRYGAIGRFGWLLLAVLMLKVLIVGRQLTLEAAAGAVLGTGIVLFLAPLRTPANYTSTAILLIAYIVLEAIQPGGASHWALAEPSRFNWIPFRSHMTNNVSGILDIIGGFWPFLALAYLAMRLGKSPGKQPLILAAGAALILVGVTALEWFQRYLPGRSADITDALLAALAWLSAWFYVLRYRPSTTPPPASKAHRPDKARATPVVAMIALVLAGTTALAWYGITHKNRSFTHAESGGILPGPEELAPIELTGFRHEHPRLPAPTPAEIEQLRAENPQFIHRVLKRADRGEGSFYNVILGAHIEPGSQDLARLFERLMELEPAWRGHSQAKPLALAYDWLYDQWSPAQRRALAAKVTEASNYLIWRIREKQLLSPYNVYLYNSPLQALMATAIATWGDLPEAELPMRWMADYWKNHVLPVWRQVMGSNGGWHEGGEYVGIGIGQAIYQLPAMWRKATGEDLFASEPGIRGFADFLVYRTRPDNSHMRWGDGGHFDRFVTDRPSLAMETGHMAAYSLRCPKPGAPSTWPWGPLANDEFCDRKAIKELPLQKHFDGIGMVIARSDWSPDATYLVFKAGDNFWSHTHLDQGAFTLFKGAPLAIDSGYYAGYGSDHHLNYSYQSIAHNVVTVTDPADTVPKPPKKRQKEPRPIANDGGQRRIGSGWGERAPLDLDEWLEKRDTYHTGRIRKYYDENDLVVAVADITPAYTNSQSGKGTFAHRTFRVKKYWRTIIYDRSIDLVIVHDNVVSADPSFTKHSLVHTLEKPVIHDIGFTLDVPVSEKSPWRKAGHLEAFVLFPENARMELVGGKGQEFLVDGQNHDPGEKFWKGLARRKHNPPEGGRWRVEISPPTENSQDRFLMVLVPGVRDLPPLIEPFRTASGIGARITGLERSLTVRFPNDREGVVIQATDHRESHVINLTLPLAPEFGFEKDFWQRIRETLWSP